MFLLLVLISGNLIREIAKGEIIDIVLVSITLAAVVLSIVLLFTLKSCYWCGEKLE